MGETVVGVISDTHGLVRPEALSALRGSDVVLLAGDVGKEEVLRKLEGVAPLVAIRGNVDLGGWAKNLPDQRTVEIAGHKIHLLHNIAELHIDPAAEGIAVVVFGHSHQPTAYRKAGVLYFNPGSAGPRRFKLPISVGRLKLGPDAIEGEHVTLG